MGAKIYFTSEQIQNILKLFNEGIHAQEIAKIYNVSKTKIINTLHENGVPIRNDRFSKETEEQILELYSKLKNQGEVARIIGTTDVSVGRVLRRNNVPENEIFKNDKINKKYTLNEKYFDVIDSDDKAYILGLIAADGCISKTNTLSISLQDRDKQILEEINDKLDSNRPIKFREYKHIKDSYYNQYYLSITNKYMANSLKKLGIIPNKSLVLKYPLISSKFDAAFIRGYMDGDGCICKTLPKVSFLGTEDFLIKIKEIIFMHTGIEGRIYKTSNPNNDITKEFQIYGVNKVTQFLEWLYHNNGMCLFRKKEIYISKYVDNSLLA